MCGRFTVNTSSDLIARFFELADLPEAPARWNAAPGQTILTITRRGGRRARGHDASWGWKLLDKPNTTINARFETAGRLRSFAFEFSNQRCVIPADGWYEWTGTPKAPVLLRPENGELLGLAGIWRPTDRGAEVVILTQAAPPAMTDIHDRMPVMVPRENVAAWLDPRVTRESAVRALVESADERVFEAVPVSTRLNRVVHDDQACAAPVGLPRKLGHAFTNSEHRSKLAR